MKLCKQHLTQLGSQISYTGSPLVVPSWAILNILAALVFWIYIITPALYYTNTWSSAYFPIQSNSIFDNMGKTYNVSKVINKADGFSFDLEKYRNYSDVSIILQRDNVYRLMGHHRFTFPLLTHSTHSVCLLRASLHSLFGFSLRRGMI